MTARVMGLVIAALVLSACGSGPSPAAEPDAATYDGYPDFENPELTLVVAG